MRRGDFLKRFWIEGLVVIFSLAFSFWLMFHTFSSREGEMLIATKAWSDFGSHIPLIRSFSLGDNWPPEYPLFPGEPIRYHFLFYFFVGVLEKGGLPIGWALNIPSAFGFFFLWVMIYLLAKELFIDKRVAVLSMIFFLFNGSLSFLNFFKEHPLSLTTVEEILKVDKFPSFAPWGPGPVSAFWNLNIYTNQRHLAAAFAFGLFFIWISLRSARWTIKKKLILGSLMGVLAGLLPFFHQPTFLILAVFILLSFIFFPKMRVFLFSAGLVSLLVALPQIWVLSEGTIGAIDWYPGYLIHDRLSLGNFLDYWWQNLGFHSIFIPVGFLLIDRNAKKAIFPIFVLFTVANLFKFSVEVAAGHKFFNFFLLLGAMLTAYVVTLAFKTVRRVKFFLLRLSFYNLFMLTIFLLILSGVIDFLVIYNDRKLSILDIPANKPADWILKNTPPNAIFLNSSFFHHPASIAGRKIFQGWPYFTWSAGYKEERFPLMKAVYESKNARVFCPILRERQISYLTVEDTKGDTNLPNIDLFYFLERFDPLYQTSNRDLAIFSTESLCRGLSKL